MSKAGYKMTEIGEIPEEWDISNIGKCTHILDSMRIPLSEIERSTRKGDFPYCGANGTIDHIDDYIFDGEHLLIAEDGGNYGEFQNSAYIMSGKFWVNNHAHILKSNSGITNNKFLLYWLNYTDISRYISGSTRTKLNQERLRDIVVPLPSMHEQQKIVEILTTADRKIDLIDQEIQATERLKKGLMQTLLTKGIGHSKFKMTEIGEIPEEWEVKRLIDIATYDSDIVGGPFGSNLKVSDYQEKGVPIIRLQNIERNEFVNVDLKYISREKADELRYHSFLSGDIVLAKLGIPIGKTCIVPDYLREGIVVADVVRIRIRKDISDYKYVSFVLNTPFVENQLNKQIIGTTRPRVNVSEVRNVTIPLPSLLEQQMIAEILTTADKKLDLLKQKRNKVEKSKKGLMQALLTGQVRVKVQPSKGDN